MFFSSTLLKLLELRHAFVVEWLSLVEIDTGGVGTQLRVVGNLDCSLLLESNDHGMREW